VIEALVANRLTPSAPFLHVENWARAFAVAEVFGIDADTLNDDRVGWALDSIAPRLDEIVGSVGARAIGEFGIDASHLHWDMTSISLVGDDEEVNQVVGATEALKKLAAAQRVLLVGDSKLVSYTNRVGAHPDPPADLRVRDSLCCCKQSLRLPHRTVRQGWRPGDHLQLLSLLMGHQQQRGTTRRQHDAHA
jgi:hypothetical protein